MKHGLLVLLSSPSGGGKTSVIHELIRKGGFDFRYSVSATTRDMRPGEVDGKDYIFLTEDEFKTKIDANQFIEWERVHQYYYGTPRKQIEEWLEEGRIILLDIDVNGGIDIKEQFGDLALSIFLRPPSVADLIERLKKRKTDSDDEINKRLKRVPMEINKGEEYDFVVVNEIFEKTVDEITNILRKHTP